MSTNDARIDGYARGLFEVTRAEGTLDEGKEMLEMLARGDLRHHPAERLVPLDLRGNQVDADVPVALEQSDRRFIAGRFDTEDRALLPRK